MPHERRHFVRVHFDAPAQLISADAAHTVHVLDLSLKGALLDFGIATLPAVGAACRLEIPLSSAEHTVMLTEAVHCEAPYVGLRCLGIDIDSVTHLRRLIELQLGDPALLERDLAELSGAALP